jgi:chemotaxis protein methyltransferase CheR
VLIYFDTDTKLRIIAKLARALQPGGVLVLGTTEMLPPTHGFEPMGLSGVYRKITA